MGRDVFTYATDDGGAIVVKGFAPPPGAHSSKSRDGTLSAEIAALEWVGDAVAAGITFEVLRSFAAHLIDSGWKRDRIAPSIESVSAAVTEYLSSVGYLDIRLTEVRRVSDQGWSIAGTADGAHLRGRADPSGQLLHIRVT
jgi:hypothetical protein